MRPKKWYLVLERIGADGAPEEERLEPVTSTVIRSMRLLRELLQTAGGRWFGKEGRDFRIAVDSRLLVPLFAQASHDRAAIFVK